jgi:nucleotide-binding universal stress UspA family protein
MIVLAIVVAVAAAAVVAALLRRRQPAAAETVTLPEGAKRILFPYGRGGPTPQALDVALRLAHAESGTLVPVFLARVPLQLPLDAPLPRTAKIVVPLQESIEQRAASAAVPVDQRIERGRSYRHALRQMVDHERFDRIVVAARKNGGNRGFDADDIAWLLRNAPGEILVLRTGPDQAALPAALSPPQP